MALIMVLGMIALISAWAVDAAYEDMISLRKMENRTAATQARFASESAVELVMLYLDEDAKENQRDHLEEDWSRPIPPLPVDHGVVSASIVDANRYFNLNDLVDDEGKVQTDAVAIARRLFSQVEVDPVLVDALVDWIDADQQPFGSGGAEQSAYFDRSYRVKNARMDRWQELALIAGFSHEVLNRLKPVATVRPSVNGGKCAINLNTADASVLLALFPKMEEADAVSLVEGRPYEQIEDAIGGKIWVAGVEPMRLSVASDAFIVRTEAMFNRISWREEYLLAREDKHVKVLRREHLLGLGGE